MISSAFLGRVAAVRERRRRKIIKREEEERFYFRGVVRLKTPSWNRAQDVFLRVRDVLRGAWVSEVGSLVRGGLHVIFAIALLVPKSRFWGYVAGFWR